MQLTARKVHFSIRTLGAGSMLRTLWKAHYERLPVLFLIRDVFFAPVHTKPCEAFKFLQLLSPKQDLIILTFYLQRNQNMDQTSAILDMSNDQVADHSQTFALENEYSRSTSKSSS